MSDELRFTKVNPGDKITQSIINEITSAVDKITAKMNAPNRLVQNKQCTATNACMQCTNACNNCLNEVTLQCNNSCLQCSNSCDQCNNSCNQCNNSCNQCTSTVVNCYDYAYYQAGNCNCGDYQCAKQCWTQCD